jgi:hypothetical protein
MRLRLAVLACTLAALGAAVAPGVTQAAPRHNHHLTIAATPNPIFAGDAVLIYGRLEGAGNPGQPIRLYHRVAGSGTGFTLIGTTTTDSSGFYEFIRPDGLVYTNRDWFVRGPDGAHSRTVHERVVALVSANASTTTSDTSHPIVFTGRVTPDHPFERVLLQEHTATGDDWRTLRAGFTDGGSTYTIPYRWRIPGQYDVRVVFPGDFRNVRGVSDSLTVTVQQAQVPDFTIATSDPIVPDGSSATISGVLDQSGTSTPEPSTVVQLWGRNATQDRFVVLADTTTGADGSYSFTQQALTTNTVYYVATMPLGHTRRRHTSRLFQGVQDVLTIEPSSTTATIGQTVTFTGTVMPDKAGDVIYLQRFGADGEWHTVEVRFVRFDSTYQFGWTFGDAGMFKFRARIPSDRANVGAASTPVTMTVTVPPVASLPPAS